MNVHVHRACNYRMIADSSASVDDCFRQPGAVLRLLNAFEVRLAVHKRERVNRRDLGVELFILTFVKEQCEPFARADAEVMATMLANLMVVFELALEEMGLATVAFDEDVFRLHHALFRRNCFYALIFLAEPSHKNGGKGSIIHCRLPIADFRFPL